MAEPFYAEYAQMFHEPADFDDIANQFIFIEHHTRDPKTGLLYHAWDESKQMPWADKQTGCSPHFWGRAIGWYAWALVDVSRLSASGSSQAERIDRNFAATIQRIASIP